MNWHQYFQGFATHAATKSKDSTKVGAVLVDANRTIRATGFNGPPIGVQEPPERRERPMKYLYASHAEANLVAFCARSGISTAGCVLYCTHVPCASCARTIIQAGIKEVYFGDGTFMAMGEESDAVAHMFNEAGVNLIPWAR